MKLWVDADACPKPVKDILFRAAERVQIETTLVANLPMRIPVSDYIRSILVPSGLDVADGEIVHQAKPGDLVITADVPLAARVIEKGATVLTPYGKLYDNENIGEQLSIRNFMDELRGTGMITGGPAPFGKKDRENFANQLNGYINQHIHKSG